MKFTSKELQGLVLRLKNKNITDMVVATDERIAIRLKSGTIVEYIFSFKRRSL